MGWPSLIERKRIMATTSDYFAHSAVYCGPSIADMEAQDRIDEVSERFDEFLREIDCKRTPNSEWYYGIQHSGIHATWDAWELRYFEPVEVDNDFESLYCDHVFIETWNRHVPRLRAIYEWLDRHEYHLNDAPYEYVSSLRTCTYVKRRDRRDDRRWDIVYAEYERGIEAALDELCDEYERLLEEECDYAYSDEAARDWAEAQEEAYV